MWENVDRLPFDAQQAVRRHVPLTRRLEAMHQAQLVAQRAQWVIKSDYGATACSRVRPYLRASRVALSSRCTAGADGSSSNARQTTSTSSLCAKRASASSNLRLPIAHQGHTTSDQMSTRSSLISLTG